MRGFSPAAQRGRTKHFANGGPVRGKGTGISDEVPDQVPEGTYIMPTDSTQAMGERQLAAMGGGPRGFAPAKGVAKGGGVPVQLSNGEFKLPPEQVHAIGVQALDHMKDATHTPAAARGFAPGALKAMAPRTFAGEPPLFFANGGVVHGLRRRFANGGVADDEQQRPNSFGDAAAATRDPGVTQVPTTSQAASPAPAAPLPGSPASTPGRTTYSGMNIGAGATINEHTTGASSGVLPVGMMVEQAQRSRQESLGRVAAQAAATPQAAGFQAPVVRSSLNDWQIRNNLRNAEISAKYAIPQTTTDRRGRQMPTGQVSPEMLRYQSLLAADQAAQGGQSAADIAAMRENAGLQREGMREQGLNTRSANELSARGFDAAAREQGENQRAQLRAGTDMQVAQIGAAGKLAGQAPTGYRWGGGGSLEAIPGGPADPTSDAKPLNESQNKSLQFGSRMQASGQNMDRLAAAGTDQPGLIKRAADTVGLGTLANWTQTPEQQQVEQSQRDFVNAVLRRESGAAISASEFDNARKQYFPQIGDSPAVAEQKRQNRELATRGMLAEVPNSQNRVQQVTGATQQPQHAVTRTVTRTGTINGRKVVQYSDGSLNYAN